MGKFIDLTGQKFGKLTVLEYIGNKKWRCECDCGNIKDIYSNNLRNGLTRSCGCLYKDAAIKRSKHGKSNTRLYHIWMRMKQRCYYEKSNRYKSYGGRGITVCDEWLNDFQVFYTWAMDNGYRDDLTIERIDVNGNYEPNNCKWSTNLEQQRNTTRNRNITYNGEVHCLSEWCEMLNLDYNKTKSDLNKGLSLQKCLQNNKNVV